MAKAISPGKAHSMIIKKFISASGLYSFILSVARTDRLDMIAPPKAPAAHWYPRLGKAMKKPPTPPARVQTFRKVSGDHVWPKGCSGSSWKMMIGTTIKRSPKILLLGMAKIERFKKAYQLFGFVCESLQLVYPSVWMKSDIIYLELPLRVDRCAIWHRTWLSFLADGLMWTFDIWYSEITSSEKRRYEKRSIVPQSSPFNINRHQNISPS